MNPQRIGEGGGGVQSKHSPPPPPTHPPVYTPLPPHAVTWRWLKYVVLAWNVSMHGKNGLNRGSVETPTALALKLARIKPFRGARGLITVEP